MFVRLCYVHISFVLRHCIGSMDQESLDACSAFTEPAISLSLSVAGIALKGEDWKPKGRTIQNNANHLVRQEWCNGGGYEGYTVQQYKHLKNLPR